MKICTLVSCFLPSLVINFFLSFLKQVCVYVYKIQSDVSVFHLCTGVFAGFSLLWYDIYSDVILCGLGAVL